VFPSLSLCGNSISACVTDLAFLTFYNTYSHNRIRVLMFHIFSIRPVISYAGPCFLKYILPPPLPRLLRILNVIQTDDSFSYTTSTKRTEYVYMFLSNIPAIFYPPLCIDKANSGLGFPTIYPN
jgi:hypothetical protein